MATETVTNTADELRELIHHQNDQLFDLRALISGLVSLSWDATERKDMEQQQAICDLRRLAFLADKVAGDMQNQLEPHV